MPLTPVLLPAVPRTLHPRAWHSVALEILVHGPLSRTELGRRLDLSPASLTRLAKPLLDSGLVIEAPTQYEARTGRPTRPLDVVATSSYFVGIKLTGDDALAVLTTLRAEVVATRRVELTSSDPESVVRLLADLVASISADVPQVTALGVCLGGLATDHREVTRAPFLGWTDPVPLAALLEQATGLPTVVDNDVQALTRAEHWFGAARGCDHFALITIGAGVGCGLVVHDAIVETADAGIGLIGHHPLDPLGPLCFVGHQGCGVAMLSIGSIEARSSVALQRPVSYEECLDLAIAGHPVAVRIVAESGRALGRLVACVANFTMAHKIILTGEGIRLAAVAREAIDVGVHLDRDPLAAPLAIEVQLQSDFTNWSRGAAATAIQSYVLGTSPPPEGLGRDHRGR
jgi:predicted NBD/HSP70 family sugar kinase